VSASTDGSPHGGALNNSGIQEITKRLLLGAGGIIAGRNKEPQNGKAETYMPLKLPVQAVVDRLTPLDINLVAEPVIDKSGHTVQIIKSPVGGAEAVALPGDPAWFPKSVNPRVAVCHVLSGYAAARCLRGRGYF
jgi:hypothetical protein